MPTFSHSKLETFEKCRLKFKYSYIDKVEVERKDTVEAFLGSCVHDALEHLYTNLRYEKKLSLVDVIEYFNKQWERDWTDSIVIVKEDFTAENYRSMGERYLKDYYEAHSPFEEGKILGLETQNFLSLDDDGKYKYHVRIDRLVDRGNGVYEVHDYKTNMRLPTQEYLDEDRQLAMYSLWVRKQFKDFKEVRLVWHFLAFNKEMDSLRTLDQLEELREGTLGLISEIEATKDFTSSVSSLCHWCLYQPICPEWKHEKMVEDLSPNEFLGRDEVLLVNEYVEEKARLSDYQKTSKEKLARLEEALLQYAQKEGVTTILGAEKKVSIKEYESLKLPPKNSELRVSLVSLLKGMGRWEEVSDLDTYSLAKILQNREWETEDLDRLKEFEQREKNCRFSITKK
ncbi:RecB family exonuclease [Acidobacteriota bacterium]